MKLPFNFGHRGAMSIAPENTLVSLAAARDAGADGVEFDVQFAKDRALVIIHDDALERTTNGHGRVSDYTLAELQALDAGGRFDARFAGERIPTLDEVFALPGRPLALNIEIKLEPALKEDTGLEQAVVDCIRRNRAESRVLISSFNWHALRRIRRIAPDLRIGVLYAHPIDEAEVADLRAEAMHPRWSLVDAEFVQRVHARGQQVNVWTVNEEADMRRMIALGIDTLMTNFPQRLKPILDDLRATRPA
ncbi:MAG: glycerophosphodiester phosphodiesterase [Chloroflexi bacterium]|nr:glycerophosphodiester phosphodiesterase [Chloroflexota bacterium]